MENQGTKRVGPLWVLIVIIIVLGIVYLAFRPAQQADAPTVEDAQMATTTDMVTDTAVAQPETPAPTAAPAPSTIAPAAPTTDGVQVIQGDGFIATVRPVEGEQPEIESFTIRQAEGENCIFSWEAEKATSCDVANVTMKTVVRGVPAQGSLQTDEPGTYQLTCKATGGKTATSGTVVCK